jgi:hypothetical protein
MAAETVPLPLTDAQMLLAWMDETFGNDSGTDWHDEDAAAVGDALNAAIENFKRMRAACGVALPASAGYKLVPVEPTKAMRRAGADVWAERSGHVTQVTGAMYRAMLDAAPEAPAGVAIPGEG